MPRETPNVKRMIDEDLVIEAMAETVREIANEIIDSVNETRVLPLLGLGAKPTYTLAQVKTKFRDKVDSLTGG